MALSSFLVRSLLAAALALQVVPVAVDKAVPDQALTKAFLSYSGWTGGDAAYSVPISKHRSLWLFGDTFIGRIDKGVRKSMTMVHSTAGWLDESAQGTLKFKYFYAEKSRKAQALLKPKDSGKPYFWPAGMALAGGKLAVFCKVIVDKPSDDSGFDWTGQELALIDNPVDPPTSWRCRQIKLPGGEAAIMPGAGCMSDGGFVYVYSTIKREGAHPCVLMRIAPADLARGDISKFEYWCAKSPEQDGEPDWSKVPLYAVTLFEGAPELSVSRIDGLPGYFAVYSENGLSANIMLRHAPSPEGPWSEPVCIYRCPEALRDPKLLCYGAKHHVELAQKPRTLVITYCLNPGPLAAHRTHPLAYFPKAVTVSLSPK